MWLTDFVWFQALELFEPRRLETPPSLHPHNTEVLERLAIIGYIVTLDVFPLDGK